MDFFVNRVLNARSGIRNENLWKVYSIFDEDSGRWENEKNLKLNWVKSLEIKTVFEKGAAGSYHCIRNYKIFNSNRVHSQRPSEVLQNIIAFNKRETFPTNSTNRLTRLWLIYFINQRLDRQVCNLWEHQITKQSPNFEVIFRLSLPS